VAGWWLSYSYSRFLPLWDSQCTVRRILFLWLGKAWEI